MNATRQNRAPSAEEATAGRGVAEIRGAESKTWSKSEIKEPKYMTYGSSSPVPHAATYGPWISATLSPMTRL